MRICLNEITETMEGAEQWVTRQWSWSRDRWPTVKVNNVFSTFQTIRKNFKKVAERSRDSGRRSRDLWPTVTVNTVFLTFQAIRKNFEKSHWTITRQWSEVMRPSADCQTTFFGRFKQFGNNAFRAMCFRSNISKTVWDIYLSSVFTMIRGKSPAT